MTEERADLRAENDRLESENAFLRQLNQQNADVQSRVIDELRAENERLIASLAPAGFQQFIEQCEQFLANYPAHVFTEESGDPGACFVVRLREALGVLHDSTSLRPSYKYSPSRCSTTGRGACALAYTGLQSQCRDFPKVRRKDYRCDRSSGRASLMGAR